MGSDKKRGGGGFLDQGRVGTTQEPALGFSYSVLVKAAQMISHSLRRGHCMKWRLTFGKEQGESEDGRKNECRKMGGEAAFIAGRRNRASR